MKRVSESVMGRPSDYTPELAAQICHRLAQGESLRQVCRDEGVPSESTVRGWVVDNRDGFSAQYARARDIGLDALADELLAIADTPQLGVKTKETSDGKTETTEGDMIEHRRLQVDSRKWYLSKMAPRKYGDKLQHTGDGGGPVQMIVETGVPRAED